MAEEIKNQGQQENAENLNENVGGNTVFRHDKRKRQR